MDKTYYYFHTWGKEGNVKGFAFHCLSLTQPIVHWAEPALALQLSKDYNGAYAGAHKTYPAP